MKKAKAKKKAVKPAVIEIFMTADHFRVALDKIGFSQMGFSRFIGVGGRTVRSWISGEYPVPKAVALLALLMVKTKTGPEDIKL